MPPLYYTLKACLDGGEEGLVVGKVICNCGGIVKKELGHQKRIVIVSFNDHPPNPFFKNSSFFVCLILQNLRTDDIGTYEYIQRALFL